MKAVLRIQQMLIYSSAFLQFPSNCAITQILIFDNSSHEDTRLNLTYVNSRITSIHLYLGFPATQILVIVCSFLQPYSFIERLKYVQKPRSKIDPQINSGSVCSRVMFRVQTK